MKKEIPLNHGFEGLEAYIEGERLREREDFKLNKQLLKSHYVRVLTNFSSSDTLQDLKLFEVQCVQIINALEGVNSEGLIRYSYATELNVPAFENLQKYIEKFKDLLETIVKTIDLRESKLNIDRQPLSHESAEFHSFNQKSINNKDSDSVSFSHLINDGGKKLCLHLKEKYKGAKPLKIVYLLYALIDLEIAHKSILENHTTLWRALTENFGDIGSRQALNKSLNEKRRESLTATEEAQVQAVKDYLAQLYEKLRVAN